MSIYNHTVSYSALLTIIEGGKRMHIHVLQQEIIQNVGFSHIRSHIPEYNYTPQWKKCTTKNMHHTFPHLEGGGLGTTLYYEP